ncbi:MAG TPA: site-specific integrase [Nakamurella sp.]|nr:site-specific integrase [Nakamurella sp.]
MTRADQLAAARRLRLAPFDAGLLLETALAEITTWRLSDKARRSARAAARRFLAENVPAAPGMTVQAWWTGLEEQLQQRHAADPGRRQAAVVRALVMGRIVQPSWPLLTTVQVEIWVRALAVEDPLFITQRRLHHTLERLAWTTSKGRRQGVSAGTRLLLVCGYDQVEQIREADLEALPPKTGGLDLLDAGLCELGVFQRSPRRGISRRAAAGPKTVDQLVAASVPEPFQAVTIAYLNAYRQRVSAKYITTRSKIRSLGYFWEYMITIHPQVRECRGVLPHHARGFVPWALAKARTIQRSTDRKGTEDRTTTYDWFVDVRAFFTDLCHWATEPGSPLAEYPPPAIPLTSHDLRSGGFAAARARTTARMTTSVMDLTREIPNIRAYAVRRWHEATEAAQQHQDDARLVRTERDAFWDWALLELLLTTGLRVEEAAQLTTLDVLKRQLADGQIYYLLHIKPSKFDRARVIPIGDGLGRVIAEMISHVKAFYGTAMVPACDRRDATSKTDLPRAPYLLQGFHHPSAVSIQQIRQRLQHLSVAAGARHADGSPLRLGPHDCRRIFATEHLNNDTPVHVIAALLGHAGLDTVMIYAKLYPDTLVEGYRTAMRGLYNDTYQPDQLRQPTVEEVAAFTASCNLRDMGTHVCALPTGEHCSRGLVCLGCHHAQPKRSAAPTFRRMITSHQRSLIKARDVGEPAGQIAARELELQRLQSALQRAEELSSDAARQLEDCAVS